MWRMAILWKSSAVPMVIPSIWVMITMLVFVILVAILWVCTVKLSQTKQRDYKSQKHTHPGETQWWIGGRVYHSRPAPVTQMRSCCFWANRKGPHPMSTADGMQFLLHSDGKTTLVQENQVQESRAELRRLLCFCWLGSACCQGMFSNTHFLDSLFKMSSFLWNASLQCHWFCGPHSYDP